MTARIYWRLHSPLEMHNWKPKTFTKLLMRHGEVTLFILILHIFRSQFTPTSNGTPRVSFTK